MLEILYFHALTLASYSESYQSADQKDCEKKGLKMEWKSRGKLLLFKHENKIFDVRIWWVFKFPVYTQACSCVWRHETFGKKNLIEAKVIAGRKNDYSSLSL